MTVSRVRGSQRIRSNAERGKERLQGFVPMTEDWHTKVCLLGVSELKHCILVGSKSVLYCNVGTAM